MKISNVSLLAFYSLFLVKHNTFPICPGLSGQAKIVANDYSKPAHKAWKLAQNVFSRSKRGVATFSQ